MQIVTAYTNQPYPNRIQLVVNPPFIGPFTQDGPLGAFNPARDLSIYVDGVLQAISSSSFDTNNNRYLIYLVQAIDPQGFVQVVHHVPNPPFQALVAMSPVSAMFVPGFAVVASYIPSGDVLIPLMSLVALPTSVGLGISTVELLWITVGVAQVRITGTNGLDTGLMGPSGIYTLTLNEGSPNVIILTMDGYDAHGNPIVVGSPPVILTATATIIVGVGGNFLVQEVGDLFVLEDGTGFILLEG